MNKLKTQVSLPLIIVSIFITTLIEYVLADPSGYVTLLSPIVGISLTFYFLQGRRTFLPIVLTYFITIVVSRMYFFDDFISQSFTVAVFKAIILAIMMILFKFSLNLAPNKGYRHINTRDILNYIYVGVIVSFIGATLNLVPILILGVDDIMFVYGKTFVGFLFGFFIFGSSLNYSMIYDDIKNITIRRFGIAALYVILFAVITTLIFNSNRNGFHFHFHDYTYIFLILYVLATLLFNYIVVFFLNLTTLTLYGVFLDYSHPIDVSNEIFGIIMIILSFTAATTLIKIYINIIAIKEKENQKMNATLQQLILSTNVMISSSNGVSESIEYRSIEFLKNIFKVGCNMFKKFDRASCYIIKDEKIKFISVEQYDIEYLNSLEIPASSFDFTLNKPKIIRYEINHYDDMKFLQKEAYFEKYKQIRESVRFTIFYNNKAIAGMAFDITNLNNNSYLEEDLFFFEQFQTLINSYYNVNETYNINSTLKNDLVMSLVRALGLFDSYTGVHSEEVAYLGVQIANKLNLGKILTNRIYWASVVHDIGKLGIQESVLQKKGQLSEEEKAVIKSHSVKGYEILNQSKGLEDIAILVKHHHERWDGTGYPSKLKGDEIPQCSQIIAICDTVSAMFKDRVYSKAKSSSEIIEELKNQRGKQFCPKVTDVMIEYIEETDLKALKNFTK